MAQIVYLSYGRGPHELEVAFSVLSALKWQHESTDRAYEIVIYAEHPEAFAGLPAVIREVSAEQWVDWSGATDFKHRRKIKVLQDAMQQRAVKTVLLDGDTWWRGEPERLFKRIGPGRSVMHIREGQLDWMGTAKAHAMASFLRGRTFIGKNGEQFEFSSSDPMWNAGVIGLDPADSGLLEEVLRLTDQLCAEGELHVLEQYAFTAILGRMTRLAEAADLVFHYWPPYLHDPFRAKLPRLMEACQALSIPERAVLCYQERPCPSWKRKGKVLLKRVLQVGGVLGPGCRTNEW
jgi:hypothetical protein